MATAEAKLVFPAASITAPALTCRVTAVVASVGVTFTVNGLVPVIVMPALLVAVIELELKGDARASLKVTVKSTVELAVAGMLIAATGGVGS